MCAGNLQRIQGHPTETMAHQQRHGVQQRRERTLLTGADGTYGGGGKQETLTAAGVESDTTNRNNEVFRAGQGTGSVPVIVERGSGSRIVAITGDGRIFPMLLETEGMFDLSSRKSIWPGKLVMER